MLYTKKLTFELCIATDEYVCLSACISRKPQSRGRTSPNFCACCLRPWLGPPSLFDFDAGISAS